MSGKDKVIIVASLGGAALVIGIVAAAFFMLRDPSSSANVVGGGAEDGSEGTSSTGLAADDLSGDGAGPGIRSQGYFVIEREKGSLLGVVVSLPERHFIPSEEEFEEIAADLRGRKESAPPSRHHVHVYRPARFALILPDGRTPAGESFCEKSGDAHMFMSTVDTYSRAEPFKDGQKTLAVCWAFDGEACKPPFEIQLDQYPPVRVPNREATPPESEFSMPTFQAPDIKIPDFNMPRRPSE